MATKQKPPHVIQVSGRPLWASLGYANERAFQRARKAGQIPIALFPLPGRPRAVYARSDDLARYLAGQTHAPGKEGDPVP